MGIFSVLVFTLGTNPVYAFIITCTPDPGKTACIVYDYKSPPNPGPVTWYFIGHGAVLNITDATKSPETPGQTISATITSFDSSGQVLGTIPLTLTYLPDAANPNTFHSPWINFTSGSTVATNYQLHVIITGHVTVTYPGATDQTAVIIDSTQLYPIPTAGLPSQPNTTYKPATCPDADGDFICDSWEDQGNVTGHPGFLKIPYGSYTYTIYCGTGLGLTAHNNNPNVPYDPQCPDKNHKDVYIQVDWMLRHRPDPRALSNVTYAFANNGVTLHIQAGNEVPHYSDYLSAPSPGASTLQSQWTDFDKIKKWWFGTPYERSCPGQTPGTTDCNNEIVGNLTGKRQVFHYVLFAHFNPSNPYSSGSSEQIGNDMGIYLGHFTGAVGSLDQQQGTFMHELGHNLGLYHGGNTPPDSKNIDWDNCKPNYLSVMSYTRQFAESYPINRALNYSSGFLSSLDKFNLNECIGVTSNKNTNQQLVYANSPNNSYKTSSIINNAGIDWNSISGIQGSTCGSNNISANINNFSAAIPVCNPSAPFAGSVDNVLNDFNDWGNLNYNLRYNSNFYDGATPSASSNVPQPPPIIPAPPPIEITINDVTGIRVSRIMELYPLVDQSLQPTVLSISEDVKQKELYTAITHLIELRNYLTDQKSLSVLDSILGSFEIANNVVIPSQDQSLPIPCEQKWTNIAPVQQFAIMSYAPTAKVYNDNSNNDNSNNDNSNNHIKHLKNWLTTNGCNIPTTVSCPSTYVSMITDRNTSACVPPALSQRLLNTANWQVVTWTPPTPPKCPYGTNPDGTCMPPPIGSNSSLVIR